MAIVALFLRGVRKPITASQKAIKDAGKLPGMLNINVLWSNVFKEHYRVLKLGRWMIVEFHNSMNRAWNALQESMPRAGFVVADVRILDKKHKTFKQ